MTLLHSKKKAHRGLLCQTEKIMHVKVGFSAQYYVRDVQKAENIHKTFQIYFYTKGNKTHFSLPATCLLVFLAGLLP